MIDYCSLWSLNISRCVPTLWENALGALPWWMPWAFWGVVALAALWALGQVKNVAGTPGVIGVLGVVAYLVGYWRGHKGESIVPHEVAPAPRPAEPPAKQATKIVPLRPAPPRKPPAGPPPSLTD